MSRSHRYAALLFAGLLFAGVCARSSEPWQFGPAGRIVAVSDIHGAHASFVRILRRSEIIDGSLRWIGGRDHLVIVGDVVDRGPDSRKSLDLIRRLQSEALAAGGRVHLLIGNHEMMNIVGDLRYVSRPEFAAFADREPMPQREAAFSRLIERSARPVDEARARSEFDARYPMGFFAHRAAYSANGEYGSWLLEQPLLVVIGDTAFVHGGLSQALIRFDGERLNTELGQQLRDYAVAMERLTASGILSPTDSFYDHTAVLDAFEQRAAAGQATWPPGLAEAAERLRTLHDALVFDAQSPAWYRGTVACSALVERDRLLEGLQALGVRRLVVGHTPTPSARVLSRMSGRVIRIDTGMLKDYYHGRAAALVIEGTRTSVIYEDGDETAAPIPQPRRVGARPAELSADELEALLSTANESNRREVDGQTLVTLKDGALEVQAVFTPAARPDFRPEVAAYRLDRLIGLEMVPVTVARSLDGKPGSLQFAPPATITEMQRRTGGLGGSAWCPLHDQFEAMYVFDSLIFNEGRAPQQMSYEANSLQLLLLGNDRVFSTRRGRPTYLQSAQFELGPAWREALESLTEDEVTEALGDVLSRRRIDALLKRRDALLEP